MDEAARIELDHRVSLYQFYVATYTKGIALFLAVVGALLKFALDSKDHRAIFATAGLACTLAILIIIAYSLSYERDIAKDFARLGAATGTAPITSAPFRALSAAVLAFWILVLVGWVYILFWLR
jgi:hypothetical protein